MNSITKILKIDLNYLIKGGFVLGLGHTSGVLVAFSLSLIFANLIDPHTYGQYKYIISIAGILGALSLSGAATTVLQSVARGFDGTLFAEQRAYLKWGLLSVGASLAVGGYYIIEGDTALGLGVSIATIANYLYGSLTLHTAYLNAKKDFKRLSLNQALNGGILLLSVGSAIFFNLSSVLWILIAYNGSQIIFQFFAYRKTLARYAPDARIDPESKNFSKHLSVGNIIMTIAEYIDKILIFQFFGPQQLALYAFAVGVPDQIRGVNKLLGSLIIPKLSVKDPSALFKSVGEHTKKYTLVSALVVVLFFFGAPYIYQLFFPAYSDAAHYASLYILLLPITALCALHGHALQIQKKVKSLYIIRIVDAGGKIILFSICIPHFGVLGAIVAVLSSKLITCFVQIGLYHYEKRYYENTLA